MADNLKVIAKRIGLLAHEIKSHRHKKNKFLRIVENLKKKYPAPELYNQKLRSFLRERTVGDWVSYFNANISQAFKEMESKNNEIISLLTDPKILKKKKEKPAFYISKKKEEQYKNELKIDEEYLERLRPGKNKKDSLSLKDYTVYEINPYGKFANRFVEKYVGSLIRNFPGLYDNLVHALRTSGTNVLSRTYVGMMIFTSIILTFAVLLLGIPLMILGGEMTVLGIIKSLVQGITLAGIIGLVTIGAFYMYPLAQANNRKRQIKNDLPFAIVHMSAVAGSGAQPIAMFHLLLSSEEYKGLEGEVKKIVNYVNLFGYELTTALRTVSLTTPSISFREFLTGMVTNIETGGSLKTYLKVKSDDAMTSYKLERKKYIETLSTYSDMYTGILIAAPLLFFVTLAIIQMLGGAIMGVSVKFLARIGTFGVLPLLNIGFIIFLNFIQPE